MPQDIFIGATFYDFKTGLQVLQQPLGIGLYNEARSFSIHSLGLRIDRRQRCLKTAALAIYVLFPKGQKQIKCET